jgi:hypothetical protein
MKKLLAGVVVIALAIGVSWPASGASPASVAKKALALATKANKAAGQAKKTANSALTVAQQGAATVQIDSGNVNAAPSDFAHFDLSCPSGYTPTGFGPGLGALELVAALPTPDGYLASYFNPSSSTTYHGNLVIVCARGAWHSSAKRLPRRTAVNQLRQFENERLARASKP